MPKLFSAKNMVTWHSACQGILIFPMLSQDAKLLKENNTDGVKFSKGPDFHSIIAHHFLIITIL